MYVKWTVLLSFLRIASAQDSNCDFYQYVDPSQEYEILSPQYPKDYSGQPQCRWIAECPPGYNCRLDCPEVSLPQDYLSRCTSDRLLISRTGNTQLYGAESYCGQRSLSVTSIGQRLSVGLITDRKTRGGGRFSCTMIAQPITSNTNCRCGERRKTRVVGGEPTGINEYPMMVGLVNTLMSDQIRCGGVIISEYYVLTAAHCLETESANNTTSVVVGKYYATKDSPATKIYKVEKFIIHHLFSEFNFDYDIALIKVASKMDFNDQVGPVCLPFKFINQSFTGRKLTVLGWGTEFFGGPQSKVLLKANLDVITQMSCRFSYPKLTDRQICTKTNGKDACQYDSGGPLLYTDATTGLLYSAGIVSYGLDCASDSPGVNTRVTALLDWIRSSTKERYCME